MSHPDNRSPRNLGVPAGEIIANASGRFAYDLKQVSQRKD